jgi:hypothetical protein
LNNLALASKTLFAYISNIEFWRERFIQDNVKSTEELLTISDIAFYYHNYLTCRKIAMQIMMIKHHWGTYDYSVDVDRHFMTFFNDIKFPNIISNDNHKNALYYSNKTRLYGNTRVNIRELFNKWRLHFNVLDLITHIIMHDDMVMLSIIPGSNYKFKSYISPLGLKILYIPFKPYNKTINKVMNYSDYQLQQEFIKAGLN